MRYSISDLNSKHICKARRDFNYELQGASKEYFKKSHLIRETIVRFLFEKPEPGETLSDLDDRIYSDYREALEEIPFATSSTRDAYFEQEKRLVDRYIRFERDNEKDRLETPKKSLNLNKDVSVTVHPAYYTKTGPIEGEFGDYYSYEIVMVHPTRNNFKGKGSNFELYSLLKYGESLVAPGEQAIVRATIYFLKREDDRSENSKIPFFSTDFLGDKGNNVVTAACEYIGGIESTSFDADFQKSLVDFQEGVEKEECSEEDCENCSIRHLCKYEEPPMKINHNTVKSLSSISITGAQEQAIDYDHGYVRINAGAGAGKTLVVALRTVTLFSKGYEPEDIILMTFTNNGAAEMRDRIALYNEDMGTDKDIDKMKICTFNSFGDDIIKEEYARLGFLEPPTVIDDVDRSVIIAELLNIHQIDGLDYMNFSADMPNCRGALCIAKRVFDIIKKNNYSILDLDDVKREIGGDIRFCHKNAVEDLVVLYDEYDKILRKENLIEFADQEILLFELLHQDPYYLERFGFKHIIIDEFQDSSLGQMNIIKQLTECASFESLMVVGDDDQSIFGFRDTRPDYIINFPQYLGRDVDDIHLLENHRSTPEIIGFANSLIKANRFRIAKQLIATRPSGKPVKVKGFFCRADETNYVISEIKKRLDDGAKYNDIAIICSKKQELATMASLLRKEGIPSVMFNPEPYAENSRVCAGIALYNYLKDPNDSKDLLTYVNAKLGGGMLEKTNEEIDEILQNERMALSSFGGFGTPESKAFFIQKLKDIDLNDDEIFQGFVDALEHKSAKRIDDYCKNFLEYGSETAIRRTCSYPGVALTTAHSSKGLEWPVVFAMISSFDTENLGYKTGLEYEERRRLLFVTATRAKDELTITSQFVAFGKKGEYSWNRFLLEALDKIGQKTTSADVENLLAEYDRKKKVDRYYEKQEKLYDKKIAEQNLKGA